MARLESIPPLHLVGALAILFIGYSIASNLLQNARIRKLGARAPMRRNKLPFGIDMAYEAVTSSLADRTHEMWLAMFEKYAGKGRYTVEANIVNRVIFTADHENMKAILATQFKDYGKGEQFTKDWYPFLGHGTCRTCSTKN